MQNAKDIRLLEYQMERVSYQKGRLKKLNLVF